MTDKIDPEKVEEFRNIIDELHQEFPDCKHLIDCLDSVVDNVLSEDPNLPEVIKEAFADYKDADSFQKLFKIVMYIKDKAQKKDSDTQEE